jgi:DNA polymerase III alpha subunit (gram-positive type)
MEEKQTKTGKPFFIIDFTDTTEKISGVYFTKESTLDKIREIAVGQDIVVRAKMSYYGEKGLSLTIDKINLCKFPEDFVMEELPLKNAPRVYRVVKPVPSELITSKNIFEEELLLGDDVLGKTFVCVDIETTGKNALSDAITEIGAVKIVDGKITEA